MAVDVLYPVRKSLLSEELRFSLRSLSCFTYRDVYVAGHIPRWCKNVVECPRGQSGQSTWVNSFKNYRVASKKSDAEQLLIMMDDIFFLRPLDSLPVYRGRKLGETSLAGNAKTFFELSKKLKCRTSWSYEFHIPFLVEKDKLDFLFSFIEKEASGDYSDLYWRSLYGNYFGIKGTTELDVKVWEKINISLDQQFLSSASGYFKKYCRPVIQELYPQPCIYEK